jgi:hypothetical protein
MQFASAVAAFALVLRGSENRGGATYDMVMALAREARGADVEGYRGEFISMVERARALSGGGIPRWSERAKSVSGEEERERGLSAIISRLG